MHLTALRQPEKNLLQQPNFGFGSVQTSALWRERERKKEREKREREREHNVCESEPISDHPYLQIQAQAMRHLINYLCVHPINVNLSVILFHKCVDIIQLHFTSQ